MTFGLVPNPLGVGWGIKFSKTGCSKTVEDCTVKHFYFVSNIMKIRSSFTVIFEAYRIMSDELSFLRHT